MKKRVNIQKWSSATGVKQVCLSRWKSRLYCIFFAILVVITNRCPIVFAASDLCNNGKHRYVEYYNDCLNEWCQTDYCKNCGYIRVHPCLYSICFMTVDETYSFAKPIASSTSKLLTNSSKYNVNVDGRVRNQNGELWLRITNGDYISADSVAFNFDYYAENAEKSVSSNYSKMMGMFFTFTSKNYDMKNDNLLGITYRYKLYSSGKILSETYTGEQIGNMIYGYTSAAKGFSYNDATRYADKYAEKGDTIDDKYSIMLGYNYRKNGTWFKDVSDRYVGKTVAIKSMEVGKYISSNTDQDIKGINAVANRSSSGTLEQFTVEVGEAGAVGFRSLGNGNYLSARIDENAEYAYVQAAFGHSYSNPQLWESFHIFEWVDRIYIQSQANGKWLQVSVNESDYPVKAAANTPSTWERFCIETINGDNTVADNAANSTSESSADASTSKVDTSVSTMVSQYYWGSDYNEGYYEGEWNNGKPNGYGKLTYDDFEDGEYYCTTIGNVKYKAQYYEGNFRDGWRYGTGKIVYEGGWKEEGTYYGTWVAGQKIFEGKFWHKDGIHYLEGYMIATSSSEAEWIWQTDTWQSIG